MAISISPVLGKLTHMCVYVTYFDQETGGEWSSSRGLPSQVPQPTLGIYVSRGTWPGLACLPTVSHVMLHMYACHSITCVTCHMCCYTCMHVTVSHIATSTHHGQHLPSSCNVTWDSQVTSTSKKKATEGRPSSLCYDCNAINPSSLPPHIASWIIVPSPPIHFSADTLHTHWDVCYTTPSTRGINTSPPPSPHFHRREGRWQPQIKVFLFQRSFIMRDIYVAVPDNNTSKTDVAPLCSKWTVLGWIFGWCEV